MKVCFLAALVCLPAAALAQKSYTLPCLAQTIAPSADGTVLWFTCRTGAKWDQFQKEAAAAKAAGKEAPSYGTNAFQDALYALDLGNGNVAKLGEGMAQIEIHPAPKAALAVVTFPQDKGHDKAILYKAGMKGPELPIDPSFLLWSADATHLYFYGGTTLQQDAWNLLGELELATMKKSQTKLRHPGENAYVCERDGHVYAGDPAADKPGSVNDEYDAEGKFVTSAHRFPAGHFSAQCKYVATEDSWHGPLPWFVVDTASGQQLMEIQFGGEGKPGEYDFRAWNPARETVLLRTAWSDDKMTVEAFDVVLRKALLSSTEADDAPVAWSADGKAIVVARGKELVFVPVP
ncbi:MAG TPA: hypothetical protein VL382_02225 [Terriglobales bacterium]|nr:hypothetical protein [Terriglobales bacterium]